MGPLSFRSNKNVEEYFLKVISSFQKLFQVSLGGGKHFLFHVSDLE